MAEALDLAQMTWGELKKRIEEEPEVSELPELNGLFATVRSLSLCPAFGPMGQGVTRLAESLLKPPAPYDGPALWEPIRVPVVVDAGQVATAAVARENMLLKEQLAATKALLDVHRRRAVAAKPADLTADAPAPESARKPLVSTATPKVNERKPGRPSRKLETLQLLADRWPPGTPPLHRLADEARQIEAILKDRHKGGIKDGHGKIPAAASIENIIREPYKALQTRRNTDKSYVGPKPIKTVV